MPSRCPGHIRCSVQLGGYESLVIDELAWAAEEAGLEYRGAIPSIVDEHPLS